jgi:hypothetical protein
MDFTGLQMTLSVVLVLTAAAMLLFFDHRRKPRPHSVARSRPIPIFNSGPLEYAPARKLAAERPLEPLVGIVTTFRPPVQMRERETVTVEMAPPPPAASASSSPMEAPAPTLPAFTIDAVLWERLIASQPTQNLIADGNAQPIDETATPTLGSANCIEAVYHTIQNDRQDVTPASQPSGMIQPPMLEELLKSEQSFTGLVVSIGINDSDSSMWHSQGLMQSVGSYIAGLLREKDFSCRTAYDEFVMVCRGEQGAQSQRRLNHVSERLWDFQLRGIGACSILFSWGGVHVQNQPLAEAIASATERMRETKRIGNYTLAHRQAV